MKRRVDHQQYRIDAKRPKNYAASDDRFSIYPLSKYDNPFPYFRQPNEQGSFSQQWVNKERKFVHDRSKLRHYSPPSEINFNLRDGYSDFIKRDEDKKDYIDDMLQWVLHNRNKFSLPASSTLPENETSKGTPQEKLQSLNTDFVSWRGLLTRLLCTPYENREGWKIGVTLYNKTYYMCEFDTEQKINDRKNMGDRHKEMTYWGYKFEQYVTTDTPGEKPVTTVPVNNNEAFCSIVRSRLGKHSLVYGGETDCYETKDDKFSYVELKTSREFAHHRQEENFKRYKLIKWWAQSFLVGTEKVVCGFRDDDGVVHRLKSYKTLDMPKLAKEVPNGWDATICFNFLDMFLQHIKRVVVKDDPNMVYLFTCHPKRDITCQECAQDSEYKFLPKWYIDEFVERKT